MSILGPKGKQELKKLADDLRERKLASDAWQQLVQIPDLQGAELKVETLIKVVPLSVSDLVEERIDCNVPPPCYCVKERWLQTYRVEFRIILYLIHPLIRGWDPEVGAGGAWVDGRSYEGGMVGSFTIRDEVVVDVSIRCPEGFFDLIKDPQIAALPPGGLAPVLVGHLASARIATLGVLEPFWVTTYLTRASLSEVSFAQKPYVLPQATVSSETRIGEVVEISAEESYAYHILTQHAGKQLTACLVHLHGVRPGRQTSR